MDFVLVGFGIGALLILAGRAVRSYGPRLRRQQLDPSNPFPEFVAGLTWRRTCRGAGLVTVLAGFVLCGLTLLLLASNASDRSGMVIIGLSCLAMPLGAGIWAVLFHHPEWRSAARRPSAAGRKPGGVEGRYDAALASWPAVRSTARRRSGKWPPARVAADASRPGGAPDRKAERDHQGMVAERSPEIVQPEPR